MRLEMWPINCKFLTLKTLHMVWETCSALKNEFSFSSFCCLSFTFHLKEPRSFSWLTLSLSLTPGCTCGLHIWRQSWFSEHKHTADWLSSNFHIQRFSKEYIKVLTRLLKKRKKRTQIIPSMFMSWPLTLVSTFVCVCVQLKVLPRDLQLCSETASGVDAGGQHEWGELVQLDPQTVGVIVRLERETFQVLVCSGARHEHEHEPTSS